MDNSMPSMADLSTIYGTYSPEMYMQGQRQVDYSNQAKEQSIEKSGLANLFSAQNNPQLLENQRLQNEGVGYDNISKGSKARLDVATEGFKLDDEKRKQALAAPEHEIKMMAAQAQQMAYSPDPAVQEKGRKLMMMSQAAIEARQKAKEEQDKQDTINRSREKVAAATNATTLQAANINAASRVANRGGGTDFWGSFYKMRTARDKHSSLISEATKIMNSNPEEAQKMMQMAESIRPQAEAEIKAVTPGSMDMGQLAGVPTNAGPAIAPPTKQPPAPVIKSIVDLQVMYPGRSADELRAAYKKKTGVDLK